MYLNLKNFQGLVPAKSDTLVEDKYATIAKNSHISSGVIEPIMEDYPIQAVYALEDDKALKLYRYKCSTYPVTEDMWLTWKVDVDIVKDPIFNDSSNRVVVTGLDYPLVTDAELLNDYYTANPTSHKTIDTINSFKLGVASPNQAELSVTGTGTGTAEDRAYVLTYVRKWSSGDKDDVSAPSLPAKKSTGEVTISWQTGQTVHVSKINDAPSGYGITHVRIFRTVSGSTDSSFQYVAEFDIADAKAGTVSGVTWDSVNNQFTFDDTVATVDLGEELISNDYQEPPADLTGITTLSNGILAGFSNNYIYFCEPYQCHAWPAKYRVAVDNKIIGLGSFGNTLIVCTDAEPLMATVSDPALVVLYPLKQPATCLSKRGIVQYLDTVYYPTVYGIVGVSSTGIYNITDKIFDSNTFKKYNPSSIISRIFNEKYYAFYTTSSGSGAFVINLSDISAGIVEIDIHTDAVFVDKAEENLYFAYQNEDNLTLISQFGSGTIPRKTIWKSRKFVIGDETVNLSAARVRFTPYIYDDYVQLSVDDFISYINYGTLNYFTMNGLAFGPEPQYGAVIFVLYADGVKVFETTLRTNKPFKLPSGYVSSEYNIEIAGYSRLYGVDIATSMSELSNA